MVSRMQPPWMATFAEITFATSGHGGSDSDSSKEHRTLAYSSSPQLLLQGRDPCTFLQWFGVHSSCASSICQGVFALFLLG